MQRCSVAMPITIHFIVGPTATGKSALALEMAHELDADILSADSRQIYKELEITSGVDIPAEFSPSSRHPEPIRSEPHGQRLDSGSATAYPYYQSKSGINLFGVAFLSPDQEWSIAHFRNLADHCLKQTLKKHFIVVGGSGLYLQSLFLDKKQLHIPPSSELRSTLEHASVEEIQQKILTLSPDYQNLFNHSDWHNPRRLIRFLEKESVFAQNEESPTKHSLFREAEMHDWIGLRSEKEKLLERITQRVVDRIDQGAIQEVEAFLAHHPDPHLPAYFTLGVKEIAGFLSDQLTKEELIELWSRREFQYAKRQMTWFKKKKYITWREIE